MKVFVLAAGYATRLYPLTRERAKPLLEVAGQPILSHILARVADLPDLSEILIVSNARFAAQFREWAAATRAPVPIRVLDDGSTEEANRLGAVGDLRFALREAPLRGEDWLVIAGDNLIEFDPAPAYREFLARRRPLLLLRSVDDPRELTPYNEVRLDPAGGVASLHEKPRDPQSKLAAIAVYFFTPEVAELLRRYLDEGGNPDAPGHFVAWLVAQTPVAASRFAGRWFDIGSLETLQAARAAFGGS